MQQALLSLPNLLIERVLPAYVAMSETHVSQHVAAGPHVWGRDARSMFEEGAPRVHLGTDLGGDVIPG